MTYQPPIAAMRRAAALVGQDRLAGTARFAEATAETRDAILEEAARMAAGAIAPLDAPGDREGARLENGVVRLPEGFAAGFRALAEGGWIGLSAEPTHGGMGLPQSVAAMVLEMVSGACLALQSNLLLTQGQIEALEAHASPELRRMILPRLISGEWTGTMNLSEPQAGSDVGAVRCRAEPRGDGTYAITGEKIWITWGDHDLAENVMHLVLARLPDAPAGTRGISLFAVPKLWPGEDGLTPNHVRTLRLEEKLGQHASPTCALAYEGARGWIVGEREGGMAAMFTMMNTARLTVGLQGVGIAGAALAKAAAHARERVQGKTADGSAGIVGHADVRRMLMEMTAETEAARAIAYDCALAIDMAEAAEDPAEREAAAARAAVLTPIAKAYGTETGIRVADLGIQVHGGVGYVEETGAAQLWRDVRVAAIYEGTNGIQAMDLVGRKLSMDGGAAAGRLLDAAEATAGAAREAGEAALAAQLSAALATARETLGWMVLAGRDDRAAGGTPFLRMMALVLGGHHLLRAALGDEGRRPVAAFFLAQRLPHAAAEAAAAREGAAPLYAVPAEGFGT
mgnify:FL=1